MRKGRFAMHTLCDVVSDGAGVTPFLLGCFGVRSIYNTFVTVSSSYILQEPLDTVVVHASLLSDGNLPTNLHD